jgi:predicted XRE-type DNA-binding protein
MGRLTKGNVIFDLGLDPDKAEELATKTAIVNQLVLEMQSRGWNQTELGRAIGMQRGDVSRLVNWDLDRFTIDRLLRAARALGLLHSIKFAVRTPPL